MDRRNITYLLVPGSCAKARAIARIAGGCRWTWNRVLADTREEYRLYRETERFCSDTLIGMLYERPAKPSLSFFSLGKRFTQLRSETAWLRELPFAVVRYSLKHQADAWRRAFAHGGASAGSGFPRFKARCGDDSFTIPQGLRLRTDSITGVTRIRVPKVGWMVLRRSGGNPYQGCTPKQAVVKRVLGRWYCTVCYEVSEERVRPVDNGKAVGLDRNVGQAAVSDGRIYRCPSLAVLEAKRRRYQRMMARRKKGSGRRALARHRCAKVSRKMAMVRANWHHHVSRELTASAGSIVVEALNVRGMTASARGTEKEPGSNVRAKASLNRVILATGWRGLRDKLAYKAAHLIEVDPAYTSQTCSACGCVSAESRRSQSDFQCVRCGHRSNADVNAALNILARGTGATGRRGAFSLETPMNRQRNMQKLAA